MEELREVFQKLNIADKGGGDTTHLMDQVLAAIADTSTIDLRNFGLEDEPKTYAEAKVSHDANKWEAGYCEEIKSLKDMKVFRLIPKSDIPKGSKVRRGCPIFT